MKRIITAGLLALMLAIYLDVQIRLGRRAGADTPPTAATDEAAPSGAGSLVTNVLLILYRQTPDGLRLVHGTLLDSAVGQFVVENLVLTLVGGAAGFCLSVLVLSALNTSSLIPYAHFTINARIFLYALAIAVFFGLLSGVYPAWRMSRLHPVQALTRRRLVLSSRKA